MDQPGADEAELERSLADLTAVNRWLGGGRGAVRLVLDRARAIAAGPVRILDVGTGAADIPLALVRAARRRGIAMAVTAADLHPVTVRSATRRTGGEPAIEVVRADARALPFPDDEFDLAMCHTLLHHFDEAEAVMVLRELGRVARRTVIATDLARSSPAYLGARLLAATLWRRHPITRHDGPRSVLAAYTPEEARQLALAAFGTSGDVRPEPIFRWSMVVEASVEASS